MSEKDCGAVDGSDTPEPGTPSTLLDRSVSSDSVQCRRRFPLIRYDQQTERYFKEQG